jgi:hypothetical protein
VWYVDNLRKNKCMDENMIVKLDMIEIMAL